MKTIIDFVMEETREIRERTGKNPERIYVGYEEMTEIKQNSEWHLYYSFSINGKPQEFMGLLLFEVREEKHLFII